MPSLLVNVTFLKGALNINSIFNETKVNTKPNKIFKNKLLIAIIFFYFVL